MNLKLEALLNKIDEVYHTPMVGMLRMEIAELYDQIAKLQKQVISGFYEDEVPIFEQGPPHHELQSVVTAEEVAGYVRVIEELRRELNRAGHP
jgi:hypothetical protein